MEYLMTDTESTMDIYEMLKSNKPKPMSAEQVAILMSNFKNLQEVVQIASNSRKIMTYKYLERESQITLIESFILSQGLWGEYQEYLNKKMKDK